MTDKKYTIEIKKNDDSTVTMTGEIAYETLAKYRKAAIEHIGKDIKIDGFRPGHIPENVLIERVGEMAILSEMAERAMAKAYPEMVKEQGLDVIGYPQVQLTKLAPENPLGFTLTVAVVPEVKLPDYKKIAADLNKKKESTEVTDEEVQKQIEDILRQKSAYERLQKKAADKKEGDAPEAEEAPIEKEEDIPIPELTDELVKTLGQPGQFESVDDFKAKIKEHLAIEKEREVTSKHRAEITDAIIEKSEMVLPKVMVEAEMNQMFAQMQADLERAQLKFEDYLEHIKKTKEDLQKEWTPSAEKRAKLQLVLNKIAEAEKIEPDAGLVDHEVEHLMEQYKDADEARVRVYVSSILANDAVMKMLEEAK